MQNNEATSISTRTRINEGNSTHLLLSIAPRMPERYLVVKWESQLISQLHEIASRNFSRRRVGFVVKKLFMFCDLLNVLCICYQSVIVDIIFILCVVIDYFAFQSTSSVCMFFGMLTDISVTTDFDNSFFDLLGLFFMNNHIEDRDSQLLKTIQQILLATVQIHCRKKQSTTINMK